MSEYSENFDGSQDGNPKPSASPEQLYKLKLSVDIREAKNFKMAANVFVQYSMRLNGKFHQFKSEQSSAIRQGAGESRMEGSFATYDFMANKMQLG